MSPPWVKALARTAPTQIIAMGGSRCLANGPRTEAWTRDAMAAVLDVHPWTHVARGDSSQPDAWASELAVERGLAVVTYGLDGTVRVNGVVTSRWTNQSRPHPLDRNRTMAGRLFQIVRQERAYVAAFGAIAPWSKTRGTHHMLSCFHDCLMTHWEARCTWLYAPEDRLPDRV